MSLGTEKIEAVAEGLKKVAVLAKKVSADKKVDLADLPVVVSFLVEVPSIVEAFKDLGMALEEGKDLDVAEVVALIQAIHNKVKEVEAA